MAYAFGSIDELGDGYGFRKVRQALGVTAFGVNAVVYPPGYDGFEHYHDNQDELYFVHAGTARFEVGGEERVLGPGGLFHVESTTPRKVSNARRRRPRAAGRGREGRLRRARRPPRRRRRPRAASIVRARQAGGFSAAGSSRSSSRIAGERWASCGPPRCRSRIASPPGRARRAAGTRGRCRSRAWRRELAYASRMYCGLLRASVTPKSGSGGLVW